MTKATKTAADFKTKSETELKQLLLSLRKEQFNMRFQRATGQLANTARMNTVRKDIARISTFLTATSKPAAAKAAAKTPAKKK